MLNLLTSMATRHLLLELVPLYEAETGQSVHITAMGGVDAVAALREGQVFDLALLSDSAVVELMSEGILQAGSRVAIVDSPIAVAVAATAPGLDLSSGDALRASLQSCPRIGLSTGPSGKVLGSLFSQWGLDQPEGRLVLAPPGVAVASLIAQGRADVGFQQLSEMLNVVGIRILGLLPDDIQTITTFSAGIPAKAQHAEAAARLCEFLVDPVHRDVLQRHGLEPARG